MDVLFAMDIPIVYAMMDIAGNVFNIKHMIAMIGTTRTMVQKNDVP